MDDLIPVSGLLAAWGSAYLNGAVSLDDAVDGIGSVDSSVMHRVDLGDGGDAVGWSLALGRLRANGARAIGLRLPAPGDVAGLPGPAEFNRNALESGQCALIAGPVPCGVVPSFESGLVIWTVVPVERQPAIDDVGQARRALAEEMSERTAELSQLDLARGRDAAEGALHRADIALSLLRLPPSHPQRAIDVIGTATRVWAAIDVARSDDGAAVTVAEATARVSALLPLERAARAALAAGYSAR